MSASFNSVSFGDHLSSAFGTGVTYELIMRPSSSEGPTNRDRTEHTYPGVDGGESVDNGLRPKSITLDGMIHAGGSAGLSAGRTALRALVDGALYTLTFRGDTFNDTEATSVTLGAISSGRDVYQDFSITFRVMGG